MGAARYTPKAYRIAQLDKLVLKRGDAHVNTTQPYQTTAYTNQITIEEPDTLLSDQNHAHCGSIIPRHPCLLSPAKPFIVPAPSGT